MARAQRVLTNHSAPGALSETRNAVIGWTAPAPPTAAKQPRRPLGSSPPLLQRTLRGQRLRRGPGSNCRPQGCRWGGPGASRGRDAAWPITAFRVR